MDTRCRWGISIASMPKYSCSKGSHLGRRWNEWPMRGYYANALFGACRGAWDIFQLGSFSLVDTFSLHQASTYTASSIVASSPTRPSGRRPILFAPVFTAKPAKPSSLHHFRRGDERGAGGERDRIRGGRSNSVTVLRPSVVRLATGRGSNGAALAIGLGGGGGA